MRGCLAKLRTACILFGVLFCALFVCALWRLPVFEGGRGYELYLGDSSSARILSTKTPALDKLFNLDVKGESVRYEGDRFEELKSHFHAQLLFTEEAAEVTNYYLFSPDLAGGVLLMGRRVNLHIAVGRGQTAAGTPLIFGGI